MRHFLSGGGCCVVLGLDKFEQGAIPGSSSAVGAASWNLLDAADPKVLAECARADAGGKLGLVLGKLLSVCEIDT
jgi:hypothetical protein